MCCPVFPCASPQLKNNSKKPLPFDSKRRRTWRGSARRRQRSNAPASPRRRRTASGARRCSARRRSSTSTPVRHCACVASRGRAGVVPPRRMRCVSGEFLQNSPQPGNANASVTFDYHNIPKVTLRAVCQCSVLVRVLRRRQARVILTGLNQCSCVVACAAHRKWSDSLAMSQQRRSVAFFVLCLQASFTLDAKTVSILAQVLLLVLMST